MHQKISGCRLCSCDRLESIISLGDQAFTGIFPKSKAHLVPTGPLTLVKCTECHLVQLEHSFDLTELYGPTYGYRSGLNRSMVEHLTRKVEKIVTLYGLNSEDLVLDIGSNDCTTLKAYPKGNYSLVGMDPTGVKFRQFYPEHVTLIPDFFSAKKVGQWMQGKKAKVITSFAMFYDLESPLTFAKDVASILANDGVWVFEQSYLPAMLDLVSYDTICHEHLEYYSLYQIQWIAQRAGLKIIDIEFNDVNGGSVSITAAKLSSGYSECTARLEATLRSEKERGLQTLEPYRTFVQETERQRKDLLALVKSIRATGKTVFGYGASTKGNVLLQYCGLTEDDMPFIAEVNEEKFGAYTPGTRIPILSEKEARLRKPDYFLVLPWHFRSGILKRETEFLKSGGSFIFPLPKIEIVSESGVFSVEKLGLRASKQQETVIPANLV